MRMKIGSYEFLSQDRILWNMPAAEAVLQESSRLCAQRVFIVSSKTLNRSTNVVERIAESLGNRFVGIFDECREHTPRDSVLAGAAAAREASPDLIVTIGGGTAIDTVKVMLICLAHDVVQESQLDALYMRTNEDGTRYIPEIKRPPCRQIVVPTTLSGAEYSNLGGCTDLKRKSKDAYVGREIGALSVILDPQVTLHTPEWLWLSTAVRAVDHAVESICSIDPIPFVDATCLHALRLFRTSLRKAILQPGDLQTRSDCQHAAWMASTGILRVQYGASHGIGHSLGAVTGMSHGHTSCIMLPAVMAWNRLANETRQKMVAEALGREDGDAAAALAELVESIRQPRRLRDAKVDRNQFGAIAEGALENIWVRTNPRPITRKEQILEILESAW